jgi:Holliday junction resolvase RusA-like endonuclease
MSNNPDSAVVKLTIKGNMPSLKNRGLRYSRNTGFYKPSKVGDWQENAVADILEQTKHKFPAKSKLWLSCVVYFKNHRSDLDIASLMDAMQFSKLIDNDNDIHEFRNVRKEVDTKNPRVELTVGVI